jgi:5'-3' exonuclease
MGVPSYFRWLISRYEKSIIFKDLPRDRVAGSVVLYLDFNGAIHPAVRSNPDLKRADMNAAVCQYLENIVAFVRPDEIYIAIDGVAPAAKMNQQRDRRYKSTKEAHFMNILNSKFSKPTRTDQVDFNMISPGTEFMVDLQKALTLFIDKQQMVPLWAGLKRVTINGSDVPGEGEHKIMQEIRTRGLNTEHPVVYGLDADLIFLSMLNNPKIVLVRENTFFDKGGQDDTPEAYSYLDINELTTILVRILSPSTSLRDIAKMGVKNVVAPDFNADHKDKLKGGADPNAKAGAEAKHLIIDYTFMCFLLGNDFLPRLPSLRIRDDSLADLIIFYKITMWSQEQQRQYLVTDDLQINYTFFYEIIAEIAHIENELLIGQAEKRTKFIRKHNDKLKYMDPYEREKEQFSYIEDKYEDVVYPGTSGWRIRYYTEHFNIGYTTDADFLEKLGTICQNYLKGCVWVLHYYLHPTANWDYQYKYKLAPSAQDIRDFLNGGSDPIFTFPNCQPVSPYVQLMSILPPDSARLLPSALQAFLTDKDSAVHYMYPIEFKISYFGNRHLHECPPCLPYINRDVLNTLIRVNECNFTEMEKIRNRTGTLVSFTF